MSKQFEALIQGGGRVLVSEGGTRGSLSTKCLLGHTLAISPVLHNLHYRTLAERA